MPSLVMYGNAPSALQAAIPPNSGWADRSLALKVCRKWIHFLWQVTVLSFSGWRQRDGPRWHYQARHVDLPVPASALDFSITVVE